VEVDVLWVKSLHIIFVVTWFAGLFYLPRLFVYHVQADAAGREMFKGMERRLVRGIMNPSALLALFFGGWLAIAGFDAYRGTWWFWCKMTLVAGLLAHHAYGVRIMRRLASDESPHSERFYRIYNELPALVLVGGVMLVVVRPF
jgi:putative membrane protein